MKKLIDFIKESSQITIKNVEDLKKFLNNFDDNATSWKNATDEIQDIARSAREHLAEFDNVKLEPVDFKSIKTPSEWNTMGKEFILMAIEQMSKSTLNRFLNDIDKKF